MLSVNDLIEKQIKAEKKLVHEVKKKEMLNFDDMDVLRKNVINFYLQLYILFTFTCPKTDNVLLM